MRVAIAGGNGLIGSALARRLRECGHEVILVGRDRASGEFPFRNFDFTAPPPIEEFSFQLSGVDAVVNAVGIFREQGKQTFDALHVKGPRALFAAANGAGVSRIIQVSALGARASARQAYFASKGRADEEVLVLPGSIAVVRPSLVFAPEGASTQQFRRWARLPISPLPGRGQQLVQPIHLDDLIALIMRLLDAQDVNGVVNAVGPRALSLRTYWTLFKQSAGRPVRFLSVPNFLIRLLSPVTGALTGGLASADALEMLQGNYTASPAATATLLGREPIDPSLFFVPALPAPAIATKLQDAFLTLRISLAVMWIVTAWVSLCGYPRDASLELLALLHLHGTPADVALWSGAILDGILGAGLLVLRKRKLLYLAQMILMVAYTLLITVWLPEQWLHPFGPVLKNVPLLAMTYILYRWDRGNGPSFC